MGCELMVRATKMEINGDNRQGIYAVGEHEIKSIDIKIKDGIIEINYENDSKRGYEYEIIPITSTISIKYNTDPTDKKPDLETIKL